MAITCGYGALGQLYLAQGKLASARAEFETLAERSPKSVAALTMVGIILQVEGDVDGARDRFERVLRIDPEAAVAANNLAWIYTEHGGNLDVALQLAQSAQKRLPGVAQVSRHARLHLLQEGPRLAGDSAHSS